MDAAAAARERYVSLATFRKDGREVRTPVWIAESQGKLYLYTNVTSGKVKRIRRSPRVRLAACNVRGEVHGDWTEATARLVEDVEERERAFSAFAAKYGWQMRLALFASRLSGRYDQRAALQLSLDL